MARQDKDAQWVEVDPASLSETAAKAYTVYKSLYKQAKAARLEFEAGLNAEAALPIGKRLVFGYNFGKLSVAAVDGEAKATVGKGSVSLSAFLSAQLGSGFNA